MVRIPWPGVGTWGSGCLFWSGPGFQRFWDIRSLGVLSEFCSQLPVIQGVVQAIAGKLVLQSGCMWAMV